MSLMSVVPKSFGQGHGHGHGHVHGGGDKKALWIIFIFSHLTIPYLSEN